MYNYMLVDAKNCIYRAVYAGLADPKFQASGFDYSVIFFRFLTTYINRFKPKQVHFFWDCPKEFVWRKDLYQEYKEGREDRYDGVQPIISRTITIVKALAPKVGIYNFDRSRQEADDLIFAFCKVYAGEKSIIISSDNDFRQIAYSNQNVDLFNPLSKTGEIYGREDTCDPIDVKCFKGEKSDNIPKYEGVGDVKAAQLASDPVLRKTFFETHDKLIYLRNRRLVDLALCPQLDQNMMYINEQLGEVVSFDLTAVNKLITIHKIRGMMGESTKIILPLKFLGNKST